MAKQLWFGIPTKKMQWVPAPLAGAQSSNVGYVESMSLENGGAAIARSASFHKQYEFEFNAPLRGSEGLNVFNKFASGFYGEGLIYFADPYIFEQNLFPAHWASPGLVELGWPDIYYQATGYTVPVFADTASNSYNQPLRTMQQVVTTGGTTPNARSYSSCIIAVPPGYTLHFGWSGSVSGSGRVYYRTIDSSGAYGTPTAITALSATSSTRMNTTVASTSAVAVQFYLGSTDGSFGQVAITSMMAQLHTTGVSPTLTGEHSPGEGHTGLLFADEARVETYQYVNPPRKALATTLVEVGGWRR